MRHLLAAAVLALAAGPAMAGEGGKPMVGQYVDLAPVALPIVEGGKLRNYVFVSLRLNLAPSADPTKLREKGPYFRDALVRAGHRRPFTVAGDLTRIDEAALKATMMRECAAIVGPGVVISVQFSSPPTPQRRTGLTR